MSDNSKHAGAGWWLIVTRLAVMAYRLAVVGLLAFIAFDESPVRVHGTVDLGHQREPLKVTGASGGRPIEVMGEVWGAVDVSNRLRIEQPVEVKGFVSSLVSGDVQVTNPVSVAGPVEVNGFVGVSGSVSVHNPVTVQGALGQPLKVNVDDPVTVQGSLGLPVTVRVAP